MRVEEGEEPRAERRTRTVKWKNRVEGDIRFAPNGVMQRYRWYLQRRLGAGNPFAYLNSLIFFEPELGLKH